MYDMTPHGRLSLDATYPLRLADFACPADDIRDLAKQLAAIDALHQSKALQFQDQAWLLDDTIDLLEECLRRLKAVREAHRNYVARTAPKASGSGESGQSV